MIKCKITVLKTSFNKELVEKYVEKERKKLLVHVKYLKKVKNL